jgi:DNA-binding response OmpR family regulator
VRVAIVADDLIWSTRLADALRAAGAEPHAVRSLDGLRASLAGVDRVVVDLTARAYDGLAAIELARAATVPVLAVGQHDDHELRRRALAAGADRVYAYRKLFEDGPRTLGAWLGTGNEAEVPT